jgi:type I restriction enzyme S subunit
VSAVDSIEQDVPAVIEKPPLPDGWIWGEVADVGAKQKNAIVDGPFGSNLKLTDYVEGGTVPVLTTKNLAGKYDNLRYISEEKFQELKRSAVYPNDILMAKIGSCGKTGIYPVNMPPAIIPANLLKVTPNEKFEKKFVFHYFNSRFFQRALKTIIRASAQPAFGVTSFRKLPFPIAPLNEQLLVVAEIEKQFSRLDEAVANLQRVKANLKRYKASVLKAAVEGRLVETEASLAHREGRSYETGDQLLQQILEDRRAKWAGRGKWKVPESPSTDTPLPDGWAWASIDQLAEAGTGATPKRDKSAYWNDGDVPWVTSSVVNGDYVDEASEFVTKLALAETNLTLYPAGTLLIAMYGEGKTRGKCAELRIPAATNQALSALQVASSVRGYLRHFLELNYEEMRKVASGGVQPNLNLSLVRAVCVPLPPLAEQVRIVAEVDRHLSIVREVVAEVDTNLKRAQALRQATLSAAFKT